MEEIYDRLPNEPLDMPDLDDLNFGVGNQDSLSDDDFNEEEGDGSGSDFNSKCAAGDEVIEEFRRERVKDNEARQAKLEELTRKE